MLISFQDCNALDVTRWVKPISYLFETLHQPISSLASDHAVVCAYRKLNRWKRKTKLGVLCLQFYFVCFIRRAIFDDMQFYSEGYFPVVWMFSFWKIVWPPNHRKRRRRSKKLKTWSLLRKPKFLCQGLEMNPEKI